MMVLLELFVSFLKIGFTSFGGLSMIPLITSEMTAHGWMTASEVSDIVAIAEMTPGPIAVNSATFVGIRIAGVVGAIIALAAAIVGNIIVTPFYAHMTTAQVVALIVPALLPFNALKFTIHGVVTFLIYKPISNLLNR